MRREFDLVPVPIALVRSVMRSIRQLERRNRHGMILRLIVAADGEMVHIWAILDFATLLLVS